MVVHVVHIEFIVVTNEINLMPCEYKLDLVVGSSRYTKKKERATVKMRQQVQKTYD